MRALAYWMLVLGTLMGVGAVALFVIGIAGNQPVIWIAGAVLIVAIVGGLIWLWRMASQEGRPAYERALSGFPKDEARWYEASGIAVDTVGRRALLADTTGTAIVPLADIQAVRFVPTRQSAAAGSAGGVFALIAVIAQIGAIGHNYGSAGLFVTTPARTWRIIGVPRKDSSLWTDLLQPVRRAA